MEITPLGDSALIVRVVDASTTPNKNSPSAVFEALLKIRSANISGVVETAPSYTTIGVFYDPTRVAAPSFEPGAVFEWIAHEIRQAVSAKTKRKTKIKNRLIEIPVCYDPKFALDLDKVAEQAALSPKRVVDLHCGAEYSVNCIGFTPGFPFLSGLPAKLATPRRQTPRKEIPAGSVAIGGKQTGVYPIKSPGGWNIIGRTPLRLFDPTKDPPALLRAGDRVRFTSITRAKFAALQK